LFEGNVRRNVRRVAPRRMASGVTQRGQRGRAGALKRAKNRGTQLLAGVDSEVRVHATVARGGPIATGRHASIAEPATTTEQAVEFVDPRSGARAGLGRGWRFRRLLFLADNLGITVAVLVAEFVGRASPWYLLSIPLWIVLAKTYGLYDRYEGRTNYTTVDDMSGVFHVFTVGAFLLLALSIAFRSSIHQSDLIVFWGLAIAFVIGSRIGARTLARRSVSYLQNTVILGAGNVGQLIARKILQHPEYGINLVGFVDDNPRAPRSDLGDLTVLGGIDSLQEIVVELDVERVVVAFSGETNESTLLHVRSLRDCPVQIDIVPRLFEAVGPSAGIHAIEGLPLIGLPSVRITRTSRWVKRALDVLISGLLLALAAPLFAFIAWRVHRESRGPVIFRQDRLGMNRRVFAMHKFRTMYVDTDESAHREYIKQTMDTTATLNDNGLYKLSRDDAITKSGRWLRRTSLDELPQLWNVFRGQMSLVGPRPCIPYETEFFEPYHFERFLVPQGLTGLWQVEGRALMTPKEALDLDVAYARSWSLAFDLSLLLRTVSQTLRRGGAA
jgi:exopolysaccharide biosynthesis polyprenyl glycosylphosphotransferase